MKDNISALLALVITGLLLFIFVQNSCTRDNKGKTTTIPRSVPIPEIIKLPELVELDFKRTTDTTQAKGYTYIPTEQKPDTTLLNAYRAEIDSLKKELMFAKAVTHRNYASSYEDENIQIDLYAETTGTLNKLQLPFYKIKEKEITTFDKVTVRPSNFSMYLGSEIAIPTTPKAGFAFKGNVFLQSKNMMYSASYDTDGRAWGGLAIKL